MPYTLTLLWPKRIFGKVRCHHEHRSDMHDGPRLQSAKGAAVIDFFRFRAYSNLAKSIKVTPKSRTLFVFNRAMLSKSSIRRIRSMLYVWLLNSLKIRLSYRILLLLRMNVCNLTNCIHMPTWLLSTEFLLLFFNSLTIKSYLIFHSIDTM